MLQTMEGSRLELTSLPMLFRAASSAVRASRLWLVIRRPSSTRFRRGKSQLRREIAILAAPTEAKRIPAFAAESASEGRRLGDSPLLRRVPRIAAPAQTRYGRGSGRTIRLAIRNTKSIDILARGRMEKGNRQAS